MTSKQYEILSLFNSGRQLKERLLTHRLDLGAKASGQVLICKEQGFHHTSKAYLREHITKLLPVNL